MSYNTQAGNLLSVYFLISFKFMGPMDIIGLILVQTIRRVVTPVPLKAL